MAQVISSWITPESLRRPVDVLSESPANGVAYIALRLLANRFTFRWSLTTPRWYRASLVNQMSTRSVARAPISSNGASLVQSPQYFRCHIIFHFSLHWRNIIIIISFTHVHEYPEKTSRVWRSFFIVCIFIKTEGVKHKRDRQNNTSLEQPLSRLSHRFLYPRITPLRTRNGARAC